MLNNTIYKLKNNKKLNIGYFGGSITEGAGASHPNNCWRSLVTKWFRDRYSECEINEIIYNDIGVYKAFRYFKGLFKDEL